MTSAGACCCQGHADRRWALLNDSTVAVPLVDLRKAAGYRLAADTMHAVKVRQVIYLNRAFEDCQASGLKKDRIIANNEVMITGLREQEEALNTRANKWMGKAKRRGPWALIGKVAVGVVAVRGGAELYRMVMR